jgi:hypothetical protein
MLLIDYWNIYGKFCILSSGMGGWVGVGTFIFVLINSLVSFSCGACGPSQIGAAGLESPGGGGKGEGMELALLSGIW